MVFALLFVSSFLSEVSESNAIRNGDGMWSAKFPSMVVILFSRKYVILRVKIAQKSSSGKLALLGICLCFHSLISRVLLMFFESTWRSKIANWCLFVGSVKNFHWFGTCMVNCVCLLTM